MVYDREMDGQAVTFGVTGYTMNDIFVLYDRATGSIWYPVDREVLQAVSGEKKGEKIEFLAKPERVTLGEWRKLHPGTRVMLPPPLSKVVHDIDPSPARALVTYK